FDLAPPEATFFFKRVQRWNLRQKFRVPALIIIPRKEFIESAAVAKQTQLFFAPAVRTREHQHQDAEILPHIRGREPALLFQDQRAIRRGRVEYLTIRMIAIAKRCQRLIVNLRRRHDPQDYTSLLL